MSPEKIANTFSLLDSRIYPTIEPSFSNTASPDQGAIDSCYQLTGDIKNNFLIKAYKFANWLSEVTKKKVLQLLFVFCKIVYFNVQILVNYIVYGSVAYPKRLVQLKVETKKPTFLLGTISRIPLFSMVSSGSSSLNSLSFSSWMIYERVIKRDQVVFSKKLYQPACSLLFLLIPYFLNLHWMNQFECLTEEQEGRNIAGQICSCIKSLIGIKSLYNKTPFQISNTYVLLQNLVFILGCSIVGVITPVVESNGIILFCIASYIHGNLYHDRATYEYVSVLVKDYILHERGQNASKNFNFSKENMDEIERYREKDGWEDSGREISLREIISNQLSGRMQGLRSKKLRAINGFFCWAFLTNNVKLIARGLKYINDKKLNDQEKFIFIRLPTIILTSIENSFGNYNRLEDEQKNFLWNYVFQRINGTNKQKEIDSFGQLFKVKKDQSQETQWRVLVFFRQIGNKILGYFEHVSRIQEALMLLSSFLTMLYKREIDIDRIKMFIFKFNLTKTLTIINCFLRLSICYFNVVNPTATLVSSFSFWLFMINWGFMELNIPKNLYFLTYEHHLSEHSKEEKGILINWVGNKINKFLGGNLEPKISSKIKVVLFSKTILFLAMVPLLQRETPLSEMHLKNLLERVLLLFFISQNILNKKGIGNRVFLLTLRMVFPTVFPHFFLDLNQKGEIFFKTERSSGLFNNLVSFYKLVTSYFPIKTNKQKGISDSSLLVLVQNSPSENDFKQVETIEKDILERKMEKISNLCWNMILLLCLLEYLHSLKEKIKTFFARMVSENYEEEPPVLLLKPQVDKTIPNMVNNLALVQGIMDHFNLFSAEK